MSNLDQIDVCYKGGVLTLCNKWERDEFKEFDTYVQDHSSIFKDVTSEGLKDIEVKDAFKFRDHVEKLYMNADNKIGGKISEFFNGCKEKLRGENNFNMHDVFVASEIDGYLVYFIHIGKQMIHHNRFRILVPFFCDCGIFYYCNFRCIYLKKV